MIICNDILKTKYEFLYFPPPFGLSLFRFLSFSLSLSLSFSSFNLSSVRALIRSNRGNCAVDCSLFSTLLTTGSGVVEGCNLCIWFRETEMTVRVGNAQQMLHSLSSSVPSSGSCSCEKVFPLVLRLKVLV